jgi:hypothetical protein
MDISFGAKPPYPQPSGEESERGQATEGVT